MRDLRLGVAALAMLALTTLVTVALPLPPIERESILFLNQFARQSVLVDRILGALADRKFVSGVLMMACIWYVWFRSEERVWRRMILTGTLAAFCSSAGTRVVQIFMPMHPRPMHNEALNLTLPYGVEPDTLYGWSSFPSDHAAVYAGLALVIWRAAPRPLGMLAVALAALLCLTRVYLGYHYITDIVGGAAIGILAVCIAGLGVFQAIGGWLSEFSYRRPALFYGVAFIMTYGIATLFTELRGLISGFFQFA
ncbi:phosphatase PAP2 family protein [Kushneria sinocarnis]|nr:phosphatase PAP2 family protein [Kushneria sinocarnis]